MINEKTKRNLEHDINAIFDSVCYELWREELYNKRESYEIHLLQGVHITTLDFPHLLTIAKNYRLYVNIFVVNLNQLGILFVEE